MQNVVVTLGMALIFYDLAGETISKQFLIESHHTRQLRPACRIFSKNLPCMALP